MSERGCTGNDAMERAGRSAVLDSEADHALIERVRAGDDRAYGELWRRHRAAAIGAASGVTSSLDPEDLVSEASILVLEAIRRGGGPESGFRPYLYAVVRNLARRQGGARREIVVEEFPEPATADVLEEHLGTLDRSLVLDAFRSLPPRWREVLWYSVVEGMSAREVGELVGLSPNAAAALSYRAREGLRSAWLQAHVADAVARPAECAWTMDRIGEHTRNGLGRRDAAKVDRHLATCRACRDAALEVRQVELQLASILIVAVLGTGGGTWLAAGAGGAATAATVTGGTVIAGTAAAGTNAVVVAASTAAAAIAIAVGVALPPVLGPDAPTTAAPPGAQVLTPIGPDALRVPGPGESLVGPSGGTIPPGPVPGGGGGGAPQTVPDDAQPGGSAGGLLDTLDGATGGVEGLLDDTTGAAGQLLDGITGGGVQLETDVGIGSLSDPGLQLDADIGVEGLIDLDLGVDLDGTIGIDLGIGLLGF